ncbi:hypothetical protein LR48_Vigan04g103200 [Vigna angularis]|uniref:Uncharacterized protein n=1 Tax=Phaseolus angularis TaxID=3914 RepID=A0A0L9UE61_PHAAN|nr:hypothetical protein LR48_Vigan04g103200 [Vigna angularis]
MAYSSSSRRKWKVARIARNANPTGWISDEDIRRKLFSLRKIKTVVSHKYLKLVSMFYSNLKMSDESFCNTIKGVDMKLIKEVSIGIVVFQPISKEGFLFQIWIGHQGLIGFTMIKNDDHQQVYPISESSSANETDSTKTEEYEWARWLCQNRSKRYLGLKFCIRETDKTAEELGALGLEVYSVENLGFDAEANLNG